jgi:glycerophosphoryl diester phosphodiesterase
MIRILVGSLILFVVLTACDTRTTFAGRDWQGHRGARGLLPENSIPGFLRALELGVTTLELDVVISADSQIVVSHEPWLSAEICTTPDGFFIDTARQREYNLYRMRYADIRRYDCGGKGHPRFTQQVPQRTHKPTLAEVVQAADAHARQLGRALPRYNIETKGSPKGDDIFHPRPDVFSALVIREITRLGIIERSTLQSFDVRTLQAAHLFTPALKTVLLVENEDTFDSNIARLAYIPYAYSPEYKHVDADLVAACQAKNIKLVPWTVNDSTEMLRLLRLGVDGIISDYPDRYRSFIPADEFQGKK